MANQLMNQNNLFEIGTDSLQFVMDFIFAVDELAEADLLAVKNTFDKQEYIQFSRLVAHANYIAHKVNQQTPNTTKN